MSPTGSPSIKCSYAPGQHSSVASRTATIFGFDADLTELETVTGEYLERVNSALEASDEFSAYVTELERSEPTIESLDPDQAAGLLSEIEDYLRHNR